jgi:transketolase
MKKTVEVKELKKKALDIRRDILTMLEKAGSGHTGGSLSTVEILVALYYGKLNVSPENFSSRERDKFILSKGHGCPALYAVLSDRGFFPREELWTLRKLGSRLQGHPQRGLPGLEISSGSLGQGLSVAVGMALGDKMDGLDTTIYCLMGDGETNEGQVWEAAMTAAHYNLDNLCGIIDFNKLQIDGMCCEVKDMGEYRKKWEHFGWYTIEIDGHDLEALDKAFEEAKAVKGKPKIVIAHTVKGKGISFIEHKVDWHGVSPKPEELEKALAELDEQEKELD